MHIKTGFSDVETQWLFRRDKFQFNREFEGHGFSSWRLLYVTLAKQSWFFFVNKYPLISGLMVSQSNYVKRNHFTSPSHMQTIMHNSYIEDKRYSDLMVRSQSRSLVSSGRGSSPGQRHCAAVVVVIVFSCTRHFTLTVRLSTQVHKRVPVNLMLGVTLRWTSIPSWGE